METAKEMALMVAALVAGMFVYNTVAPKIGL